MKEQMLQEILTRVDALALKLGVGAEHLFGLFVTKQYINFFYSLAIFAIGMALVIVAWRVNTVMYNNAHSKENDRYMNDNECARCAILWIIGGLFGCAGIIALLINGYWILQPELGAFQDFLSEMNKLVPGS